MGFLFIFKKIQIFFFSFSALFSSSHMSNKVVAPELKTYLDKRMSVLMNGNRRVVGILRGFDQFLNVVLDEAHSTPQQTQQTQQQQQQTEGTPLGMVVIRGNSIIVIEPLERV
eukprot:TRINITY_DN16295_c0_g1_i1.p1 TRINITY_DN16295_c0_g1~~TRINITY_DN16295_c0_g1_i1.p1  ORF type:complete len:113 (+),score=31.62 TRINITY_DN16295_c0_g1_i1:45-383(+)